jgi:hypothetical protein
VNAADSHRVRLLLPYLAALGCRAEVLTVDPADVPGPHDPWLEERLPRSVSVHRVRAWRLSGWGLNGLAQRSFAALYRRGNELLHDGRFDLVFFSTTEFLLHGLGPLWRRRWGVPFCMDFQDPWFSDYYRQHPDVVPPGGRAKFAMINRLHQIVESAVVRRCSGLLAVSPAYITDLERRYGPAVGRVPRLVAGFPAEPGELAALPESGTPERGAHTIWRYIGRGGEDMSFAARSFFMAWRSAIGRNAVRRDEILFQAAGTSYAAAGTGAKTIEPLAVEVGLAGSVTESPDRLVYSDTLRSLRSSDALIVFGSNDPAYTASKIYPYLLAGKPLLVIVHEASTVVPLLRAVGGAMCVTFNEQTSEEQLADEIGNAWFESRRFGESVPLDRHAFETYTAASQAGEVVAWLKMVVARAQ